MKTIKQLILLVFISQSQFMLAQGGYPCDEQIDYNGYIHCTLFNEDGSFSVNHGNGNGEFWTDEFDVDGNLVASNPSMFPNNFAVENNEIVERADDGTILNTIPIEADLVTLYNSNNNDFGAVTKNLNGEYLLIGRQAGPAPEPYTDYYNFPPPDLSSDSLFLYKINEQGESISNGLQFATFSYADWDDEYLTYKFIVPTADGGAEVYLEKRYKPYLTSDVLTAYRNYSIDPDFQSVNLIESGSTEATFVGGASFNITQSTCNENFYNLYNGFYSWSPSGTSLFTRINAIMDYSVSPTNKIQETYHHRSNQLSFIEENYHIYKYTGEGAIGLKRYTFSDIEPFLPGKFVIENINLAGDTIVVDSILLDAVPTNFFIPDFPYSYI